MTAGFKRPDSTRNRPLLTMAAVAVDAPPLTDEALLTTVKAASWTDAHYTQGPNGTVVDTPAGADL